MSEEDTKHYSFEVGGGFEIKKELRPISPFGDTGSHGDGDAVAFKLPDGRTVRLIVALEIESKDGSDYIYITSELEMALLGFECLDYSEARFTE